MDQHQRTGTSLVHLSQNGVGKLLVDSLVPVLPRVIGCCVNGGGVGEVPDVVLNAPQQGISKDVVVLVVGLLGGEHKAELQLMLRQPRWYEPIRRTLCDKPIALSHRAGNPRQRGRPSEAAEDRNHAATAAAGGWRFPVMHDELYRTSVACQHHRTASGNPADQVKEHAILTCALRSGRARRARPSPTREEAG